MWHSPARELRYEGRCDVTVGQGEVFHLLFFFLRLWQNGNMPSADPFLLRLHTPPHPQLSPCSDLSHILTHTHTPSVLLCLRRIKQIAKKFSGHFLNEDFVHCLKDYHVSITASLRLSCSSGPSFIRPEQTVFLFYKVKRCDPLTSKPLQLSQTLYIYIGTLQIYLSASITSHLSFNLASFFLFLPALSVSTSKVKKTVQG